MLHIQMCHRSVTTAPFWFILFCFSRNCCHCCHRFAEMPLKYGISGVGAMWQQWQQIDENAKNGAKNAEFFVCFQQKYRLFQQKYRLFGQKCRLSTRKCHLLTQKCHSIVFRIILMHSVVFSCVKHCFLLWKTMF